jgi:acetyl-CoA carboxylase biotin carboxyl carrier protein
MNIHEREMPWIQRIEDLVEILNGSTIGELELREAGSEIIIRRRPDMVLVSTPMLQVGTSQAFQVGTPTAPTKQEDRSLSVVAPLTGVYYSAPSPSQPPFVNVGEVIHVGQIIALVEAMKVFNEIPSEVAGRVLALTVQNGDVVHKGDVLIKVDPLS